MLGKEKKSNKKKKDIYKNRNCQKELKLIKMLIKYKKIFVQEKTVKKIKKEGV